MANLTERAQRLAQRALVRFARIQVSLALGASMLVMRALSAQTNHEDARVRYAARAAHWYLARREREKTRQRPARLAMAVR